MKSTQLKTVLDRLEETGEISRNYCLSRYISRLSAIIYSLKKKDYKFKEGWKDGDYVYTLISKPTYLDENIWSKEELERRKQNLIPKLF